jgi:hypothetical protein
MNITGRRSRTHVRCLAIVLLTLAGLWATATPAAARHRTTAPVPAGAFLQSEDLSGVGTTPVTDDFRQYLRPPQPSTKGWYRSAALRYANGTISILYPVSDTRPTVLLETVSLYRADGAQRYMRGLRRAVTRCGSGVDAAGRWSLLATGVAGRDSLLIRLQQKTEDLGGNVIIQSTYIVVARTGKAVVALADIGWEEGNGHPDIVRALAAPAVQRVKSAG